jgi:hypothetical protein
MVKHLQTLSDSSRILHRITWLELLHKGEWFRSGRAMSGQCPCLRIQEIRTTRRP